MGTPIPAKTTGERALNAALAAGFTIGRHAPSRLGYFHQLTHPDGRTLTIYTVIGTGRLIVAQGYVRHRWNTTRLAVRSVPALIRLLATHPEGTP